MSVLPATIDLNADLGEGFPNDGRLLELVTSASIACGGHAGDRGTMMATLQRALMHGVAVGAHPGYADRATFGRREMKTTAQDVEKLVLEQVAELKRASRLLDHPIRFVKPHGALYNQAQRDDEVARGVIAAMKWLDLPLLGQPGSVLETLAAEAKIRFIAEGFPERRYQPDGRLVPRSQPDAVLHDPREIEAQVLRLASKGHATLCIHGDDPDAVAKAENVRGVLERHGIQPRFWGD